MYFEQRCLQKKCKKTVILTIQTRIKWGAGYSRPFAKVNSGQSPRIHKQIS